jgi:hypothetical protein
VCHYFAITNTCLHSLRYAMQLVRGVVCGKETRRCLLCVVDRRLVCVFVSSHARHSERLRSLTIPLRVYLIALPVLTRAAVGCGYVQPASPVWLITELMMSGSLDEFVRGTTARGAGAKLSTSKVVGMLADVAKGLVELHGWNTFHRNLCCANVLVGTRRRNGTCVNVAHTRKRKLTSSQGRMGCCTSRMRVWPCVAATLCICALVFIYGERRAFSANPQRASARALHLASPSAAGSDAHECEIGARVYRMQHALRLRPSTHGCVSARASVASQFTSDTADGMRT